MLLGETRNGLSLCKHDGSGFLMAIMACSAREPPASYDTRAG